MSDNELKKLNDELEALIKQNRVLLTQLDKIKKKSSKRTKLVKKEAKKKK